MDRCNSRASTQRSGVRITSPIGGMVRRAKRNSDLRGCKTRKHSRAQVLHKTRRRKAKRALAGLERHQKRAHCHSQAQEIDRLASLKNHIQEWLCYNGKLLLAEQHSGIDTQRTHPRRAASVHLQRLTIHPPAPPAVGFARSLQPVCPTWWSRPRVGGGPWASAGRTWPGGYFRKCLLPLRSILA
jgi:hypothetical protein